MGFIMSKFDKKQKAISFRNEGYSVKEISKLLNVAQSSASLWVRGIKLTSEGKRRIEQIQIKGRLKSVETNKNKRLQRQKKVIENCLVLKEPCKTSIEEAKLYLALLYWGEGAKTGSRVTMTNSDPDMIKSFGMLLRKGFVVNENKVKGLLHLHSYHNKEEMIDYWSKCAMVKKENICIYNKKESGNSIKDGYKGCFSFRYGDVATFQEIMLIIDRFKKTVYN